MFWSSQVEKPIDHSWRLSTGTSGFQLVSTGTIHILLVSRGIIEFHTGISIGFGNYQFKPIETIWNQLKPIATSWKILLVLTGLSTREQVELFWAHRITLCIFHLNSSRKPHFSSQECTSSHLLLPAVPPASRGHPILQRFGTHNPICHFARRGHRHNRLDGRCNSRCLLWDGGGAKGLDGILWRGGPCCEASRQPLWHSLWTKVKHIS